MYFAFGYDKMRAEIRVVRNSGWTYPKRFQVLDYESHDIDWTDVPDVNAAIQLIFETVPQERLS